jgi:hypothetical protein
MSNKKIRHWIGRTAPMRRLNELCERYVLKTTKVDSISTLQQQAKAVDGHFSPVTSRWATPLVKQLGLYRKWWTYVRTSKCEGHHIDTAELGTRRGGLRTGVALAFLFSACGLYDCRGAA